MSQTRRLLFYIILNILVSACTTLVILVVWDRVNHQFIPLPSLSGLLSAQATAPVSTQPAVAPSLAVVVTEEMPLPTLPGAELARLITIDNIFGVGNLKDELVLFKRVGEGELKLTNWRLDDGNGNRYLFPDLTLYPGGAVQVHTAAGTNSVVDLFWGKDAPLWQEGKVATLYDADGNIRATYRVP